MKKLLFIAALLMASLQVLAANLNLEQAQAAAARFINSNVAGTRFTGARASSIKLLHAEMNSTNANQPVYYIFNTDKGFVIVSGDDRAQSILAYGDKPLDMKRMPDNMKFWLNNYKHQLEYLQSHPGLVVSQPSYKSSLQASTVAPLLTAEWDQDAPYYNQCPTYNGSRCLTGCPATSLSMVFYFWKYPTDPTPPVEGYVNDSYGFTIPDLPSITFDWDNMLDKYTTGNYNTTQADAVAWLMRYVGQEEHMDYTPSGSGAMGDDILRAVKFFGYDEDAQLLFKTRTNDDAVDTAVYYNDDEWAALLQNELYEGRPVVYCAYDYDSWWGWSGHAFNVDGYTPGTNTYHVNWGWSGEGNGDFALNAFTGGGSTYNIEQQMVMGIQPPVQGPRIRVSPSKLDVASYVDQSATETFIVKGQELTSDITLTLNDESGAFSIDATSVAVGDQESGKVITVTYAPLNAGNHTATITLHNPDAEDVTVTINGVATLQTFAPVMLPADSTYINLTQFRADWTDQTADKYVDSYILEVRTRSVVELLDSIDGSIYPGTYQSITLSEPWGGQSVQVGNNAIYFNNYSYESGCITYTVPDGYYNDVFSMQISTVPAYYGSGNLTVGSEQTAAVGHQFEPGETFTWSVIASAGEKITITTTDSYFSPDMRMIKVYAGDVNELNSLKGVVEEGGPDYRLISGITKKNYLVENLTEGGTFYYRVRGLYSDGTQSAWSKSQLVTLFANDHAFALGDVNHDGLINVADVTSLIAMVLGSSDSYCAVCGDMNGDTVLNVADVTALITKVLNQD